jgi:hypothetical protein
MAATSYRYELRHGDEIIATGHLSLDQQLHVGEEIAIGPNRGTIKTIEPLLATRETRLVVQVPDPSAHLHRKPGR